MSRLEGVWEWLRMWWKGIPFSALFVIISVTLLLTPGGWEAYGSIWGIHSFAVAGLITFCIELPTIAVCFWYLDRKEGSELS